MISQRVPTSLAATICLFATLDSTLTAFAMGAATLTGGIILGWLLRSRAPTKVSRPQERPRADAGTSTPCEETNSPDSD